MPKVKTLRGYDTIGLLYNHASQFMADDSEDDLIKRKSLESALRQRIDLTCIEQDFCLKHLNAYIHNLENDILQNKLSKELRGRVKKIDFLDVLTWRDDKGLPLLAPFQIYPECHGESNLFGIIDQDPYRREMQIVTGMTIDGIKGNLYSIYQDIVDGWHYNTKMRHPFNALLNHAIGTKMITESVAILTQFTGHIPESVKKSTWENKYRELFSHLIVIAEPTEWIVDRKYIDIKNTVKSTTRKTCVLIGVNNDNYFLLERFDVETREWIKAPKLVVSPETVS